MLSKLFTLLQDTQPGTPVALDEGQRALASAALLIEVAVADHQFDEVELKALKSILTEQFDMSSEEVDECVAMAEAETQEATSTYQFTRLINDHCSEEEKFHLITAMWAVAYADGELDKYEEYVIRKVADLIHVRHGDFIRAKHAYLSSRT